MTVTTFARIPDSTAAGAQVIFTMSTVKNMSESGNTNRKSLRPVKRNYLVTVSPDDADEMQAVVMAMLGDRYPMAIRDYGAYTVTDEECQFDAITGDWLMGRTWTPVTGTKSYFERILIPETIIVTVNGSVSTPTRADFGRIKGLSSGDTVTIQGTYLKPVCFLDAPTANLFGRIGGVVQYQFASIRLEELFEKELQEILGT